MSANTLQSLGWKTFFQAQLDHDEMDSFIVARVTAHHRTQVIAVTQDGAIALPLQLLEGCGDVAVGDWLLLDSATHRARRRLDRQSYLERKAAGETVKSQPIAANIDTLFIVSSCNQDFNLSRLERYLVLAIEAGITPVVVLTKADLCDDPAGLRQQAERLHSGLIVETLDARDAQQTGEALGHWCGPGQTIALVGSSGVGKSTLAMALGAGYIATAGIREDDDKGRHTTTSRSIHHLTAGGLLIDNPGIRELQLPACEQGVSDLFEDVTAWFHRCKFRNCRHNGDAGCAVEAAIESGELDARRFKSYLKLQAEQARNSESLAERRAKDRKTGKFYKTVQEHNRKVRRD